MFTFENNIFETPCLKQAPGSNLVLEQDIETNSNNIDVVFVSDMFVKDYVGGAELTTQALIDSSPYTLLLLRSRDVTLKHLKHYIDKFWIFGNFTELNPRLIEFLVPNIRYSVIEFDYKYCTARSPEKHKQLQGTPCNCYSSNFGKTVSTFFLNASYIWWMSKGQKDRYESMFSFLEKNTNSILSSVFDNQTLSYIQDLRVLYANKERKGWIVLGSNSWIKGADAAVKWCKDNNKKYEIIWNIPYEEALKKLAMAEGFVYLPLGGDTCPRMVIEAKLLGCELHLNDNVQHKDEQWFMTKDVQSIEKYLQSSTQRFWTGIKEKIEHQTSISGYTTTFNCVSQGYPFEQCIESMLQFCDEVCIVDGGSTDETLDRLDKLKKVDQRIKVKIIPRDWTHPRSAIFDGMQKAAARSMCTGVFCWQMDSDEIVHEDDVFKIKKMLVNLPDDVNIVSLPVIEYWGGKEKVRVDVHPWKWRLSRNNPNITHGIPARLRMYDENGDAYALKGTDGCDMIDKKTGHWLPHATFYGQREENLRQVVMTNHSSFAMSEYERWFNVIVNNMPSVFHYSWYDIPRKIRLYKTFWTRHWVCLNGESYVDTAETNMMFDVPWSQVTEDMIIKRAKELEQIGGWVWHRKWEGVMTPWIRCDRTQPKIMQNFFV